MAQRDMETDVGRAPESVGSACPLMTTGGSNQWGRKALRWVTAGDESRGSGGEGRKKQEEAGREEEEEEEEESELQRREG